MKSNITLIGMPGAGKSTVGIVLAKLNSCGFIDTDILIQINRQKPLQEIIDTAGYLNLRTIEEEEVLKINVEKHVIATGGSVVYSEKAMRHLKAVSDIVFLEVDFDIIKKRLYNIETRGIARPEEQTIEEVFTEREALYKKYAEHTVETSFLDQDAAAEEIVRKLKEQ
ncbi:MAG: shikimate kinase [Victivallales bacterium]|nr:shikimate kinase [Victivallales bacterium]